MQAPRQAGRMRVGRCMQRKSWGGEAGMRRVGLCLCVDVPVVYIPVCSDAFVAQEPTGAKL